MNNTSNVKIHMVSSLDGYIAKKDGSISWLQSTDYYEKGITLSDEAIADFLKKIDCYVMGSTTYEHAWHFGWPYGNKSCVVLTSRELSSELENVMFYSGDLTTLIDGQLRPRYRNIWVVGGANVVKSMLQRNLVDELVLSMMPVLLGEGIPFFDEIQREYYLHLKEVNTYQDGMVEIRYGIVK